MTADRPIPMLDLSRIHSPMKGELERAFREILERSNFINGPAVSGFEESLAAHVGAGAAVGVSSGTDALLVALMALKVGPGDEVITTPFTFFATAGCVARLGATPVFADIDPVTFNIDPASAARLVTDRTVGIIPVHLFGRCADMDPVLALAKERGLWVLEDAAQSIGATYRGRQAGTMGRVGTYSFFPAKNLGALGDGGAVVTDDEELAQEMRALRGHGAKVKYYHDLVGGNFRLDALQAALLAVKLPHLTTWEEGRRRVAARYLDLLGEVDGIELPREEPGSRHVFNQYVVRVEDRDGLMEELKKEKVGCAVYYPVSLHLQPCFGYLGYEPGSLPEAERACLEALALPVDPFLEEEAQDRVVAIVRRHLARLVR